MTILRSSLLFSLGVAVLTAIPSSAQQKRAIAPSDCVTVRDLQHDDSTWRSTIKISPDGNRVVYPVKSPNLETNENEIELYVRGLPTDPKNSGKPILVGDISAVQWRPNGRTLTVLMKENGRRVIKQVDSVTGNHQVLFKADTDITEYSFDRAGNTLVYGAEVPHAAMKVGRTPQEVASGYRIPFQTSSATYQGREKLFLTRRIQGKWITPKPIMITSPLSRQPAKLVYGYLGDLNVTLSPDGTKLLVAYHDSSESMPEEWRSSGFMQHRNSAGVGQEFHLLVLYDLVTGDTTAAPLQTPWVVSAPLWSPDSKSFVVVAHPPVGSDLERENLKTGLIAHSAGAHLFWVEPSSGKIENVAAKVAFPWGGPLFWDNNGSLFVQVASLDTITRYARKDGDWREVASWHIPLPRLGSQVATDGDYVVGDFNDTITPPQLFLYRLGAKQVEVFAKLNTQFDDLTLAHSKEVQWKTSSGFDASGLLLLPPNYTKGVKYPLVIQTKPFGSFFVCSFGDFPSFVPQPLANAGVMYLGQIATKEATQREEDYFPKGYPGYQGIGGVAEAAFAMDLWDSAVKALDAQGLIDSNRVGIIGFSRTGWYTEFILTHSSQVHYRAATVADNVQYDLGEYWLFHDASMIKEYDLTYGGPPYGATLKNWLNYSVSFNVDKIHTPLLMEQMGYGLPYDNVDAPPLNLVRSFEVFSGLYRLNKPVELYYYPNEEHTPDHPQARLATLQRNLDWYRFWLQDYERPNPEDPEQYVRWRKLRQLQQENGK